MSVYTSIDHSELEAFLAHYSLGKLVAFEGITAGIENTNYFVTTSSGEFVLTIFETVDEHELPYFLDLMAYLAEREFPSAHPLPDDTGHYMRHLKNKPAALVHKLSGKHIKHANLPQCRAVGKALGHMHAVGQQFSSHRANPRGFNWCHETADKIKAKLPADQQQQLQDEIAFQQLHQKDELPRGVIHADLFRDNALFDGDKLTGIIDFYYACNDILLYDLAITVNDWCVDHNGKLNEQQVEAFVTAYQTERPLNQFEIDNWSRMLRAAALRFWLSRSLDWHFPRDGELTHSHDPDVFQRILALRTTHKSVLPVTVKPVDNSVD
ncbi:MAG: homoserine kinase [Gammaproteobacteria bacterium]